MKKFLLLLLVVLTVFTFAACKNDPATPEPEPTPEPAPEPAPEPEASVVYKLTAAGTGDATRFQLKWSDEEYEVGSTFSFKFKGITLKEYTIRSIDPSAKIANCVAFSGEPDSDGWYSFSYEIPDYTTWNQPLEEAPEDPFVGLGLSLFTTVSIVEGDVLRIKDITLNGEALSLAQENNWPGVNCTIAVEE